MTSVQTPQHHYYRNRGPNYGPHVAAFFLGCVVGALAFYFLSSA